MRKIITVAYYEILRNIRDIKMLLIIVISPIVLILILGTSLESFLTMENMPRPIVGYVNQDDGNLSASFDIFIHDNQIKRVIEVKDFTDLDNAKSEMSKEKISCIIFINKDYSVSLNNDNAKIEVYGKKDSTFVSAIVSSYVNNYNVSVSLVENGIENNNYSENIRLERGLINSKSIYPSTMDYYSVQTILQILLLCGIFGVSVILRDHNNDLYIRINNLPIKKYELLTGRIIGSIFYSFLAAIVTILFSKYVYKANWDGNVLLICLTILMYVIIAVGIGVLLGILTKNYITSFGIIGLLSIVLSASAGAFSPKTTIKEIAVMSPNYYAINVIMGTVFDLPKSIIIKGFTGLSIMIIVIYGLIIFFEGRRKYDNI